MSLINTMLRDLDKRRAGDDARKGLPSAVRPLPEVPAGTSPFPLALLAILLAGAGAAAWWLQQSEDTPPPAISSPVPPVLPTPSTPAAPAPVAPATAAVPPAPTSAPAAPADAALVARRGFQAEVRRADIPAPEPSPTNGAPAETSSAPPIGELRLDARLFMPPATRAAEAPVPASPAPVTPPAAAPAPKAAAPAPHAAAHAPATAVAAPPVDPDDWRRAQTLLAEGRPDQAEPLLRRALQAQPGNVGARQALLGILLPARRNADAADILRQGLTQAPEQTGWAINLARLHAEANDYPAAWDVLSRSLAHAPQNPDYQAFCGTVLQRLNRPAEAQAHYRTALRLKPREGRWWVGLGIALEAEGKTGEARESYQRARTIGDLPPEVAAFVEQRLR